MFLIRFSAGAKLLSAVTLIHDIQTCTLFIRTKAVFLSIIHLKKQFKQNLEEKCIYK